MKPQPTRSASAPRDRAGALFIAAGIFLSRIVGLFRQRVLAHYLGNSTAAAALSAALRIPNFLQNLFGEGVLSASFIPVYASLQAHGRTADARRLAEHIFGLLACVVAILAALGVIATPQIVEVVAPGFQGEARALTIQLVRILFPATGLLVLSAWCLGVLNSHGRFFLPYAAPVLWNAAIIAVLLWAGRSGGADRLAVDAAWAAAAGSALQLGVQLPTVASLLGRLRPGLSIATAEVREVLRNFVPVVIARGVVQVSAYIDAAYASLISARAFAALSYAQAIYLLPVSLFGMAVSAAELPAMSRTIGTEAEVSAALRNRLAGGLFRIAFFVVPSAAAFLSIGDVIAGGLLQTGRFSAGDTRYTWYLLAGSAVGLLASTMGRLYSSAFYALRDTRTPLKLATGRVSLTAALAWYCVRYLPSQLGLPRELGAVGITASTGLVAWFEFLLLRKLLDRRIGRSGLEAGVMWKLWFSAAGAAAIALVVKWSLGMLFGFQDVAQSEWGGGFLMPPRLHPILSAAVILSTFGAAYFAFVLALGVPGARSMLRRGLRRRKR